MGSLAKLLERDRADGKVDYIITGHGVVSLAGKGRVESDSF